jgi:hypothetical protein
MPTFIEARLPPSREQQPHEHTGGKQLRLGRDADAVPPAAAVEELLPTGPQPRNEMLEIGHRRRRAAEHRGVGDAAARREQGERDEAAADLEAPVGDVLVRYAIAGDVQDRPEQQREPPRTDERTNRAAGRDMERDDHRLDDRVCSSAMGFLDSLKKAIQGPVHIEGSAGDDPDEIAAAFHEESHAPHESDADLETVKEISEGPRAPGAIAGFGRVGGQSGTPLGLEGDEDPLQESDAGMGPEEDRDPINPGTE